MHGCDNPKDSIFSVPFGGSHRRKDFLSGAAIKELGDVHFNEVPLLSDGDKEGLYILMRSGEEGLQASVPSFHFIIGPLSTTEHPLVHRPFTRRISRLNFGSASVGIAVHLILGPVFHHGESFGLSLDEVFLQLLENGFNKIRARLPCRINY